MAPTKRGIQAQETLMADAALLQERQSVYSLVKSCCLKVWKLGIGATDDVGSLIWERSFLIGAKAGYLRKPYPLTLASCQSPILACLVLDQDFEGS